MSTVSAACGQLAYTGLGVPILAVVIVAIACLLAGIILIRARRRPGDRRLLVALIILLGLCAASGIPQPSSAQAADTGCVDSSPAFTLVQTSIIRDLAPGSPVVPIAGTGTNRADTSIYVDGVVVRIVSVTKARVAAHGTCDKSDYVIENPRMPVDETVSPGDSFDFSGASIGFSDRATNQDACKGATIHLRYDLYDSVIR
jgi:hypothetical protein